MLRKQVCQQSEGSYLSEQKKRERKEAFEDAVVGAALVVGG